MKWNKTIWRDSLYVSNVSTAGTLFVIVWKLRYKPTIAKLARDFIFSFSRKRYKPTKAEIQTNNGQACKGFYIFLDKRKIQTNKSTR